MRRRSRPSARSSTAASALTSRPSPERSPSRSRREAGGGSASTPPSGPPPTSTSGGRSRPSAMPRPPSSRPGSWSWLPTALRSSAEARNAFEDGGRRRRVHLERRQGVLRGRGPALGDPLGARSRHELQEEVFSTQSGTRGAGDSDRDTRRSRDDQAYRSGDHDSSHAGGHRKA